MKKLMQNKWLIGGLVVAGIAIIWYIYKQTKWVAFDNIGDSRYLPTRYNDMRLGLQMQSPDHGFKAGDKITIDHNDPTVPKGETTVLDVVSKAGLPFIVTQFKAPANNPDITGKVKKI